MLIYNGERYVKPYSRRQAKRADERMRKKYRAERKERTRRICKQRAEGFKMIDTSVFYGN